MEGHLDMSHLQVPKHMGPPQQDEASDLEELEQFAKAFKQRRIKLGFTQVQRATGSKYNTTLSFCRFMFFPNPPDTTNTDNKSV
jgi:class 2 POU domain transcription factor